jgi:hypothetical protein
VRVLVLVVAVVALLAATATDGALGGRGEEIKLKFELFPCVPVGEDDAGGEAEWESDNQLLKVEVWGATDLAGKRLDVLVITGEDLSRIIDLIEFGFEGSGSASTLVSGPAELVQVEVADAGHTWLSSDRRDC